MTEIAITNMTVNGKLLSEFTVDNVNKTLPLQELGEMIINVKTKRLNKVVAFVLLLAMQWAILPFYHILHDHHSAVPTDKYGHALVKSYEKPCCQSFHAVFQADLPVAVSFNSLEPVGSFYQEYNNPLFTTQFSSFSNKAPPVNKV